MDITNLGWVPLNESVVNKHDSHCNEVVLITVTPEPQYISIIYGFVIVFVILELLGLSVFLYNHKNYLHLKARPRYVAVISTIIAITYAFFIFTMETRGRHTIPCAAYYVLQYIPVGSTMALLPSLLILYVFKLVQMKLIIQKSQMEKEGKEVDLGMPSFIDCMKAIYHSKGGYIIVDAHSQALSAHPTPNVPPKPTRTAPADAIEPDVSVASPTSIISRWFPRINWETEIIAPTTFMVLGMFPIVLALVGRIYTYNPSKYGCYGCEFQIIDIIMMGVSGTVASWSVSWIIYAARNEPDPLRIKTELFFVSALTSPFAFLLYPLLFAYPAPHLAYKINYHIFAMCTLFINQSISTWGNVFYAWKMRRNARKKKELYNIDVLVNHEVTCDLLLKHCVSELCAENLLFYKDILKWKDEYDDASIAYLGARTQIIYTMYLSNQSSFEVNISGTTREKLKKTIKFPEGVGRKTINMHAKPPKNVFDVAIAEIKTVLSHDILPRFLASEAFKKNILSTSLSDQLQMESKQLDLVANMTLINMAAGNKTIPAP